MEQTTTQPGFYRFDSAVLADPYPFYRPLDGQPPMVLELEPPTVLLARYTRWSRRCAILKYDGDVTRRSKGAPGKFPQPSHGVCRTRTRIRPAPWLRRVAGSGHGDSGLQARSACGVCKYGPASVLLHRGS
jgi:hypothetical protein